LSLLSFLLEVAKTYMRRDCFKENLHLFAPLNFFFPNVKEKEKQYFRLVFSIIAGSMDS